MEYKNLREFLAKVEELGELKTIHGVHWDREMGGITEILRLCAIAEAAGVVVAPHFNPALFIHVAAAAPAMKWLEDFPVLEHVFAKPLAWDKNGDMAMPTVPGHGIEFHPDARGRYLVRE